jgi:diadenosine tetraphosphatase ApaH/serine/threonine PP2A family protein phosphatase
MIFSRPSSARKMRRPRLPDGVRIYSIGDIHGRVDLLDALLMRIEIHMALKPTRESIEVFLGDYVDRGPASQAVLERLAGNQVSHRRVFLKGNHETFITDFINRPSILQDWQRLGGLETLLSYGVKPTINAKATAQAQLAADFDCAFPESHRRFLDGLQPSFTCGDYFFAHAGVRPGIALEKQREEDLLWIREDFLFCEDEFDKVVIHGHTPVLEPDIRPNRINIDTGAFATGRLTCLILEDDTVDFI